MCRSTCNDIVRLIFPFSLSLSLHSPFSSRMLCIYLFLIGFFHFCWINNISFRDETIWKSQTCIFIEFCDSSSFIHFGFHQPQSFIWLIENHKSHTGSTTISYLLCTAGPILLTYTIWQCLLPLFASNPFEFLVFINTKLFFTKKNYKICPFFKP